MVLSSLPGVPSVVGDSVGSSGKLYGILSDSSLSRFTNVYTSHSLYLWRLLLFILFVFSYNVIINFNCLCIASWQGSA